MQSAEQAPGFGGDDQEGQEDRDGSQADDAAAGGDEQEQPGQHTPQAAPGADPCDDSDPGKPLGKSWQLVKATGSGGNPLHDPLGQFAHAHGERAELKSMVAPLVRIRLAESTD